MKLSQMGSPLIGFVEQHLSSVTRPVALGGSSIQVLESPHDFFTCIQEGIKNSQKRVMLMALYLGLEEERELALLHSMKRRVMTMQKTMEGMSQTHCKQCNEMTCDHRFMMEVIMDAQRCMRPMKHGKSAVDVMVEELMMGGRKASVHGSYCKDGQYAQRMDISDREDSGIRLRLFHSPMLRGLLHRTLPVRVREIIGVQHMKMYIFDNDVILSGANLSESYFTNRQDRGIVFRGNAELADRLWSVAACVGTFSYSVIPNVNAIVDQMRGKGYNVEHPRCIFPMSKYTDDGIDDDAQPSALMLSDTNGQDSTNDANILHTTSQKFSTGTRYLLVKPSVGPMEHPGRFCTELKRHLERVILPDNVDKTNPLFQRAFPGVPYIGRRPYGDLHLELNNNKTNNVDWSVSDTWLFPTVQAGFASVRHDEALTLAFLQMLRQETGTLGITSAYLNLSSSFEKALAKLPRNVDLTVLTSSMESNGFYGSHGMSGNIPLAYSLLEQRLWSKICNPITANNKELTNRVLREYHREGHEFHAKGIFWQPVHSTDPMVVTIGSSNFGVRSMTRDLECQAFIVTRNIKLKEMFFNEWMSLIAHSTIVKPEHFAMPGRRSTYLGNLAVRMVRSLL